MILIIGPAFSGKKEYAYRLLEKEHFAGQRIAAEVQERVREIGSENVFGDASGNDLQNVSDLADRLCEEAQIMTASETGAGIVPMGREQREIREKQGRLLALLAKRADCVVRVFYGLPEILKGDDPLDEGRG